jgi:hypothetical protein
MNNFFNLNKTITSFSLFCAMLFAFLSCNKSFEVSDPQQLNRWQKLYGSYYNERLNDVCLTDSGHVLIGTMLVSPGVDERSLLIFANGQGDSVWSDTVYANKAIVHGYAVAMAGNKVLAVSSKKVEGAYPQMTILTYNRFGKRIDTTTITVDVLGTLALKEIRFTHCNTDEASLVVLDSLKDQDACITYKLKDGELTMGSILMLQGRAATNRIYLKEKDKITSYMSVSVFDTKNKQYIRAAKINNNIFQWSTIFNTDLGHSDQTAGVLLKPDTLIVSSSFKTNGDSTGIALWKFSEGGLLFKTETTFLKGIHVFHECIQPNNDTIVFIGDGKINTKNASIFFATVHSNAKVIDKVFFGNSGLSSGKFIRYVPAYKNFLIAGDVYNSTNTDFFTIKTDVKGIWTH